MIRVKCANCGIEFGLTKQIHARRLEDGAGFFCPNGHENVYRPSQNDKLRARVKELLDEITRLEGIAQFRLYSSQEYADLWRTAQAEATKAKLRAAGYKSQWLRLKRELEGTNGNTTE